MNTITPSEKYKMLPEWLKKIIDSEIAIVTSEELENVKKRIDERKSQIIAGVILHVQKEMQIETFGEKLVITVLTK